MGIDLAGMVALDEHECLRLLDGTHFGRVALCVGALPVILPVHYALLDGDPVFRTDAGTKLEAASAGHVLCLEADAADDLAHTGWSVLVTGPAEVLEDGPALTAARALPLRPWVGNGDVFIRIRASIVSGRRVCAAGR
jgi:nitroimidazol reductase NimA-like FMN-containing flavoprotein (pyridoxamine 5'-phosphate oxidase superfamily)